LSALSAGVAAILCRTPPRQEFVPTGRTEFTLTDDCEDVAKPTEPLGKQLLAVTQVEY
jgi:hypothetical protein